MVFKVSDLYLFMKRQLFLLTSSTNDFFLEFFHQDFGHLFRLGLLSTIIGKIFDKNSSLKSKILSRLATGEVTRIYQFITNNHALFYLW